MVYAFDDNSDYSVSKMDKPKSGFISTKTVHIRSKKCSTICISFFFKFQSLISLNLQSKNNMGIHFPYPSKKADAVCTHWKLLIETLLISTTTNIFFEKK